MNGDGYGDSGDATDADASMYFSNNTGAMYEAESSMPMYATVSCADASTGMVTITGVAEAGTATITVTATDTEAVMADMQDVHGHGGRGRPGPADQRHGDD